MRYKFILPLIAILVNFYSCRTVKDAYYLQPDKRDTLPANYTTELPEYQIQPGDMLHIRVTTLDEATNALFNKSLEQGGGSYMQAGFYLTGYMVNDSGYIKLPVVGKIYVEGQTLELAYETIQKVINGYLQDPELEVKFVSFHFTVLGEVKSPGTFTVYRDRLTVMDAIGMAKDITYNANIRKVHIYRHTKQKVKPITIDLTKDELITSTDYYIMPNDVIYVEPLKMTIFRRRIGDYAFLLSLTASIVTTVLLLTKL